MMPRFHLLALACATALLGACSSLPEPARPAAPVPDRFPGADATASTAPAADAVDWRDFFTDSRLREVIALALASNRDLRVAALNIEKARAQYRIQGADLLPSIGIDGGKTAQRLPADLSARGEATTSRQYSATLGFASYELDFFGRVRALETRALEIYLATEEAHRAARISLVAEVARAWLTLAAERERLSLAERTRDNRTESYRLIRRGFEIGMVSALDLRQAETLMESARAQAALHAARASQAENALNLLAGATVPAEWRPAELGDGAATLAGPPAGVASEVLVRRPDILQAEHALRAANADIGAARAAFFPSITLTTAVGTASAALDGLFAGGSGTWSFAPRIHLPIFESGRLRAGLETATAQRDIQLATYEKAIQTAFREVADALTERASLAERLDAHQRLAAAAADAARLTEARYRGGIDSHLGLLDAERTRHAAEQELIDMRLAEATNRVTLYRALGGGWQ